MQTNEPVRKAITKWLQLSRSISDSGVIKTTSGI
jgi:hypothetical protein